MKWSITHREYYSQLLQIFSELRAKLHLQLVNKLYVWKLSQAQSVFE